MTLSTGAVVIGRNEGARLKDSLASVLASGCPVVYVDSGSTDDSLRIAADLGVDVHTLDPARPFSAARGRNEGFMRLLETHPTLESVLFLDGDCTIDDRAIPAGAGALAADDRLALVCSPVRETDRDRDIWKLLCDLEWDQPPGPIEHCGGIFLIRTEAYRDIRGMDANIVAGEEPEMCLQLQRKEWKLLRIEEGLVEHDVGEFGFGGWWIRSRRSGLAFLLGFLRDGFSEDRQNLRETLRPWIWGAGLPLVTLGLFLWHPLGALLLLLYPLHLMRMVLRLHGQGRPWRDAWVYSCFNLLGRWAEITGQVRLLIAIALGSALSRHAMRNSPVARSADSSPAADDAEPTVGVVVIGRNEGERLQRCLESVVDATRHVVYVDSGSTDGSTDFARSLGVHVVDLDMSTPFTAARARNAGFRVLDDLEPDLDHVQFVDGDCSVAFDWLRTASRTLQERPEVVAVAGRRREQFPQASVYNLLADREWDTPLGPVKWCGGDVLMRAHALREVDGYDDQLIACEEPELCFRLRSRGWMILRVDAEMTQHDANITRFSQWWKRSTRTGYSYFQASSLHRGEPGRFLRSEIRSALIWGFAFPLIAVTTCLLEPWLLVAVILVFLVQAQRIHNRSNRSSRGEDSRAVAPKFAFFSVLINLPIAVGMLRYLRYRMLGRQSDLIEYK